MLSKQVRSWLIGLFALLTGALVLILANTALGQGQVTNQLTYQGTLFDNGQPVNGARDMVFRLYTDDLCTAQAGPDIVRDGVAVEEGFFTVYLDVNPAVFDGQALWIQPVIGGIAFDCQVILPAPYALSLRPGALIRGSTSSANGLLEFENQGPGQAIRITSDNGMALYGNTAGGPAIYGYASGGYGVQGVSSAPGSAGVRGETSTSNTFGGAFYSSRSSGVSGVTASVVATPIPGNSSTYVAGVRGVGQSAGFVYGVYAETQAGLGALYATNNSANALAPDVELGGGNSGNGVLASDKLDNSSNLVLLSNDDISLYLDYDQSFESSVFRLYDRTRSEIFSVDDQGNTVGQGTISAEEGLLVGTSTGDGLYIIQAGAYASSGVSGASNGVEVRSANNDGLMVGANGGDGVDIWNAALNGLYVRNAGQHGLYINNANQNGVDIDNVGTYAINAADGMNYFAGDTGIGVASPTHRLHVVDSISGSASTANHVALIENVSAGSSADILVIKMPEIGAAVDSGNNYITFHDGGGGSLGAIQGNGAGSVTYAGAGNDYAEYLSRLNLEEEINPGDVVGVFAGRVSKVTEGADLVLAASTGPIVSGNDPGEANRESYTLVAFLGQVDLRVRGPVEAGDFVVPSGLDDGTAVAVAPSELTLDQLSHVIGQAWEDNLSRGVRQVRVLVGLVQPAAFSAVVGDLDARLAALEQVLGTSGPASTEKQ